jgi:nicotinamidase-related amidase
MSNRKIDRRKLLASAGGAVGAALVHSQVSIAADDAVARESESSLLNAPSGVTPDGYIYQQNFLPRGEVNLDLSRTALFITDPQNDFISPGGAAWDLVGEEVQRDKVVEHQVELRKVAKEVGIRVFYSPHMYTEQDYRTWPREKLNAIDKAMFALGMFKQGTWGHDFHPDMKPDDNTIVMNPHKGLSNFWTGDAVVQLRVHGITTLVMCGMSCNLCVESHCRDAAENGFEVLVVADATAGAGPLAKKAALVNYEFIANEVVTTSQIIARLRRAKA